MAVQRRPKKKDLETTNFINFDNGVKPVLLFNTCWDFVLNPGHDRAVGSRCSPRGDVKYRGREPMIWTVYSDQPARCNTDSRKDWERQIYDNGKNSSTSAQICFSVSRAFTIHILFSYRRLWIVWWCSYISCSRLTLRLLRLNLVTQRPLRMMIRTPRIGLSVWIIQFDGNTAYPVQSSALLC